MFLFRAAYSPLSLFVSFSLFFNSWFYSVISFNFPLFLSKLLGYRCYVRLDILRQLESKKRTSTSMKSCDLRLGFSLTWKQQLSKIKLVEEKKEKDWVRLMLTLTKAFFLSYKTKIVSNFLTMHQILILTMDLNSLQNK